jgi:hypothetical protein
MLDVDDTTGIECNGAGASNWYPSAVESMYCFAGDTPLESHRHA